MTTEISPKTLVYMLSECTQARDVAGMTPGLSEEPRPFTGLEEPKGVLDRKHTSLKNRSAKHSGPTRRGFLRNFAGRVQFLLCRLQL